MTTQPVENSIAGVEMRILRIRIVGCLWAVLAGPMSAYGQVPTVQRDLSQNPSSGHEAIAFSPNGKFLASVHSLRQLRLWELSTGKPVTDIEYYAGKSSSVGTRGLVFSPDGKTVAIGVNSGVGTTGHIYLWDIVDEKSLRQSATLKGHSKGVRSLAFSPDGKTLYSASLDQEIRLWDIGTGKSSRVLSGHRNRILGMALSPDGKVLVSGDPDEVKVWNLDTNKEVTSWKVDELVDLTISPDGKTVAVACFPKGGITFWDVASGKQRAEIKSLQKNTTPMAFSSDGKRFVSVIRSRDAAPTVMVTDLGNDRVLAEYNHRGTHVHVAAFSPDGKSLVSGDYTSAGTAQLLLIDVSNTISGKGKK